MIAELASALKRGRVADLEAARYVYLLSNTDAGAAEINAELPKYGLSPVSKGYLSKLKTVYKTWVVEGGYSEEELAPVGIHKLYVLRKNVDSSWLERAKTSTDEQLTDAINGDIRDTPLQQPFVNIRLPESTNQALEAALVRFRDATRHKVTMPQFVELLAALVLSQEDSALSDLWKDAHGELVQ